MAHLSIGIDIPDGVDVYNNTNDTEIILTNLYYAIKMSLESNGVKETKITIRATDNV